ncbi:hypothetical protein TNCV_223041 [Trichonephila clavipes]|nr:hypothetical protein TNCV_223041 [Trichonephila clavipes]
MDVLSGQGVGQVGGLVTNSSPVPFKTRHIMILIRQSRKRNEAPPRARPWARLVPALRCRCVGMSLMVEFLGML